MRRSWYLLTLVGPLFFTACGPGQIAVTAEIEVPDPEAEGVMVTRPISDKEIQVLPFNRDEVFDSLEQAFSTPKPATPEDLLNLQQEIAEAQAAWQAAEATWGAGRARLQEITEEMEPLNRGEAQYVALFREFQDVEAQVNRAERAKDRAFDRFTELQSGYIQRADSMQLIQDQWADEAYAAAFDVFNMKVREAGRDIVVDTTDAQGYALVEVPPGEWWVYSFYEQAYSELYWNIRITVERGEPVQVLLNRETAEVRPIL